MQRRLSPLVERADEAADVVGHIVYRRLVDSYTDAALETRSREQARRAQTTMLELFQARNVVEPVVREIECRVAELH